MLRRDYRQLEKVLTVVAVLMLLAFVWTLWVHGSSCVGEAHAEPLAGSQVDAEPNTAAKVNQAMLWVVQVLSPNRGNPVARKPLWRKELARFIAEEAKAQDLPWELVTSIVYRESSFRPKAKGDIDAEGNYRSIGLMQVGLGVQAQCRRRGLDLTDPHDQIKCGTWHLRDVADNKCDGDLKCAFSWYASGRTGKPDTKHLKSVVRDRFRLAKKMRKAGEAQP